MKSSLFLPFVYISLFITLTGCMHSSQKAQNQKTPPTPQSKTNALLTYYDNQKTNTNATQTNKEQEDISRAVSSYLGVQAKNVGGLIEHMFKKNGRPSAYITGEEGGGAWFAGVRYGHGKLWMRDGRTAEIYWQGPSIGLDVGANGSRVFTLIYNLHDINDIFQRFGGAEGSAIVIGGLSVSHQNGNGIVIAPVRIAVGARLGVNIGYISYTRKRKYLPF